ncbi:hypothetical protein [Roseomonas sp. BN140053]|uniref:hypothetical protein n=1 Tax=Roseomonas sp. BN140053 TaxID=3391898 RepID=UPI0039E9E535
MQGVLNQAEFDNPRRLRRWMLRASGWRNATAQHEGGMWDPKEVKLRRGQVMFRIGHSQSWRGPVPMAINLSSPWWFEGETFADIGVTSNNTGLGQQAVARLKLSVSERYGVFDTIICVRLRESLGALRGEGNPVFDPPDPDSTTPPPVWAYPGSNVKQCFIPGLRDFHERPTDLPDAAFELLGTRSVHAWQAIDDKGFLSIR